MTKEEILQKALDAALQVLVDEIDPEGDEEQFKITIEGEETAKVETYLMTGGF